MLSLTPSPAASPPTFTGSSPGLPILRYRHIARAPLDLRWQRQAYVSPAAFAWQMRALKLLGYQGLSIQAALDRLREQPDARVVAITLDDGYRDNLAHALPVLQRLGFGATCFVVSDAIGRFNRWDGAAPALHRPLMTRAQLLQWLHAGMEVGSHTRRHPPLTRCGDRELDDEISGSRRVLEDLLGVQIRNFSYPHGNVDRRVAHAVHQAGYESACTLGNVKAHPQRDRWQLARIDVPNDRTLCGFVLHSITGFAGAGA